MISHNWVSLPVNTDITTRVESPPASNTGPSDSRNVACPSAKTCRPCSPSSSVGSLLEMARTRPKATKANAARTRHVAELAISTTFRNVPWTPRSSTNPATVPELNNSSPLGLGSTVAGFLLAPPFEIVQILWHCSAVSSHSSTPPGIPRTTRSSPCRL